jgi:hypothetical protein
MNLIEKQLAGTKEPPDEHAEKKLIMRSKDHSN